jgi:hypothetical protein
VHGRFEPLPCWGSLLEGNRIMAAVDFQAEVVDGMITFPLSRSWQTEHKPDHS